VRNVSALADLEKGVEQIPVTLVALAIPAPWGPLYLHDLDVPLYLNPTTNAVSAAPGAGLVFFQPYDLELTSLDESDEGGVPGGTVVASNADETWFGVVNNGSYRDTDVQVWDGNLSLGATPDQITFVGAVRIFRGTLAGLSVTYAQATLTLENQISPYATQWPYETYTVAEFKHMPANGTKLAFGTTVKTL
jgi:hypothetical protein